MTQNMYDDPSFFVGYSQLDRSVDGLAGAAEWPAIQTMLPDLRGLKVVDLGCGFGWHCRYARQQNAQVVVGVDLSEKMIAHGRELTNDPRIEYRQSATEDIGFPPNAFDVVISSLALHYVERFDLVRQKIIKV